MSSRRHERVSELFLKACDLTPEARPAFLEAACADDQDLRIEIESLLAYDEVAARAMPSGGGTAHAFPDAGALPSIPGYALLEQLGAGGMGKVYLAEDLALGRRVAIKTLPSPRSSPSNIRRFFREARTLAKVEHPHIVRIYSFGTVGGLHYFVMEYVDGESLAARIHRRGRLSADESLRVLSQSAAALEAAWEHAVVHRDIKPANILLDAGDAVRVADFGLARVRDGLDGTAVGQFGSGLGTPYYVAPEQARGAKTDFRADIYSLGIVLYEMITGEPPFRGDTPLRIIEQRIRSPLPALRDSRHDAPAEVESLFRWMTRKDPSQRPLSYAELRRMLDALAGATRPSRAPPCVLPAWLSGPPDSPPRPDAPFVGRETEVRALTDHLDATLGGAGRVVFVAGEAGCGKTALISHFTRAAQQRHPGLIVARGHCNAQTGAGDPYLPFRQVLDLLTGDVQSGYASGALPEEHAKRLWGLMPCVAETLVDDAPDLVGTFVSGERLVVRAATFSPAPTRWRARLEDLVCRNAGRPRDPGRNRSDMLRQYTRALQSLSREHPLILEIEDLHWADVASCGLLFHLGRSVAGSRILILGTYRPIDVAPTRDTRPHSLQSVVDELERVSGYRSIELADEGDRGFSDALVDCEPNRLGPSFRRAFHRRTGGHPLFAVELLRGMRDSGMLVRDGKAWVEGADLDWAMLPARVEGAIRERLARLPADLRETLELASVQGESFSAEVLAHVLGAPVREIVRRLSTELDRRYHLVRAQEVRLHEGRRLSTYGFRHVLFQSFLYDRLDDAQRACLHEATGGALEAVWDQHADEVAVSIARHYQQAAIFGKAVQYLLLAGERAVRLSANDEALAHFRRGLRLLERLPPGDERERRELALRLALGPPLMDTAGPGSSDLSRAYSRARELCQRVGHPQQLFQTLFILVHHHANRGQLPTALEIAERLVQVAEGIDDATTTIMSLWARGFARHYLGRFAEGRDDHERVLKIYDPSRHRSLAFVFGMDPAASALAYDALATWCLGSPDRASKLIHRALSHARRLKHPSSLAHVLTQACILASFAGDRDALCEHAETLQRLSTERGVVLFQAWSLIFRGALARRQQRPARATKLVRAGLSATRAAGSQLSHAVALAELARARTMAGRLDEAAAELSQAQLVARETGERQIEAELHRLEGELWMARETRVTAERAEACWRRAVDVARRQHARSWELRAMTSWCRWSCSPGRTEAAHRRLATLARSFPENLDTPDLRRARALLAESA